MPLPTQTYVGCVHQPNTEMVKITSLLKPLKLLDKMVYFYELKLLQKKNLPQLQICYFFCLN